MGDQLGSPNAVYFFPSFLPNSQNRPHRAIGTYVALMVGFFWFFVFCTNRPHRAIGVRVASSLPNLTGGGCRSSFRAIRGFLHLNGDLTQAKLNRLGRDGDGRIFFFFFFFFFYLCSIINEQSIFSAQGGKAPPGTIVWKRKRLNPSHLWLSRIPSLP